MTNSFQLLPNSGFERFLLDSQAPLVSECLEAPAESVADSYAIGLSVSQRDSCYWARMAARFQLLEYAVEIGYIAQFTDLIARWWTFTFSMHLNSCRLANGCPNSVQTSSHHSASTGCHLTILWTTQIGFKGFGLEFQTFKSSFLVINFLDSQLLVAIIKQQSIFIARFGSGRHLSSFTEIWRFQISRSWKLI